MRFALILSSCLLAGCMPSVYVSDECEPTPIIPLQKCKAHLPLNSGVCPDVKSAFEEKQCFGIEMDLVFPEGGRSPGFLAVVPADQCYQKPRGTDVNITDCNIHQRKK